MERDDSQKPEFASWRSYQDFARRVRHARRYVWDDQIQAFLDTVVATLRDRDVTLPLGMILYRAQRGIDYDTVTDDDGNEIGDERRGFGPSRMKPQMNRAIEGRVNPSGIPVLYLSTTEQTAISEVRPWVGSELSVAQFKTVREVRGVDLSKGHGETAFGTLKWTHVLGEEAPDAEQKANAVWVDIDNAFSRPVTLSDDAADYVPTQILAELFRNAGYDAVIYKSQFGEKGYNLAFFNVDDAEAINCAPYRVTTVDVKFEEIGNRWFRSKEPTSVGNAE